MYHPLELNEHLAAALTMAADSKSALSLFTKEEESQTITRVRMRRVEELDEILCDAINRIADLMSEVLAHEAVKESTKRIQAHMKQGVSNLE